MAAVKVVWISVLAGSGPCFADNVKQIAGQLGDGPFRDRRARWYLTNGGERSTTGMSSEIEQKESWSLTNINVRLLSLESRHPTDGGEDQAGSIISRKRRP